MRKNLGMLTLIMAFLFTILLSANGYAQKGIMRLTQQTLMHEVRETPSPLDGQHIAINPPRFMWPDKFPHLGAVLDGVEEEDFRIECACLVVYIKMINRRPFFLSVFIYISVLPIPFPFCRTSFLISAPYLTV